MYYSASKSKSMQNKNVSFASYLLLLIVGISAFSSCEKQQDDELSFVSSKENKEDHPVMLIFQTKEQLEEAVREGKKRDPQGRALNFSLDGKVAPGLRTLGEEGMGISYEDLVPDRNLRDLLNTQGEIQVGDSVYAITALGTFFAHKNKLTELRQVVSSFNPDKAVRVNERTLQIGAVKLYETFADATFEPIIDSVATENEEKRSSARAINPRTGLDENVPMPDLESFPKERGRRTTQAGKILQSISFRKSHIAQLPDNNRRRLNCAVYDYDYAFVHSIGITAKVQKKMWYGGWAKVKYCSAGTILVGYRYALVRYPYPQNMYKKVVETIDQMYAGRSGGFIAEQNQNFMDYLPRPKWFKKELFNGTSPIYAITKKKLTFEDVLSSAKPLIHSLIKRQAGASWVDDQANLNDPVKEKLVPEAFWWVVDNLKKMDFVSVQVPIYAEDGIYILYKGGWYPNLQDESEVDVPIDHGIGRVILSVQLNMKNGSPQLQMGNVNPYVNGGWSNNNPIINNFGVKSGGLKLEFEGDKTRGTLIGGDFFALAYGGGWVGYNLTW